MIHILIVDDQPDVRLGLAYMLSNKTCRIGEAADGAVALDYLRKHRVDVVLADLYMPGVDGLELVASIRAMALPRPKVVIVSGVTGREPQVEEAAKLAADAYLSKPVSRTTLLQTLGAVLGSERAKHLPA